MAEIGPNQKQALAGRLVRALATDESMDAEMICPQCGSETQGKFCAQCGAQLIAAPPPATTSEPALVVAGKLVDPAPMSYIAENTRANRLLARCPDCGRVITMKRSVAISTDSGFDLHPPDGLRCKCGAVHHRIIGASQVSSSVVVAEPKQPGWMERHKVEKCGKLELRYDCLKTPDGTAYFADGPTKTTVDTAGNLAVTKRATLTRMAAGGLLTLPFAPLGAVIAGAGFKKGKKLDTRELYLMIETPNFVSVNQFKPDEGKEVRKFAAKITNTSMAASRKTAVE